MQIIWLLFKGTNPFKNHPFLSSIFSPAFLIKLQNTLLYIHNVIKNFSKSSQEELQLSLNAGQPGNFLCRLVI
jgi:hypothetical protein